METSSRRSGGTGSVLESNVRMLAARDAEERARMTVGERIGECITGYAGEFWFAGLHAVFFGGWILVNTGWIPLVRPFDVFPFPFLTFLVSLEAIFLSLFILLSQRREARQLEARAKLELQINLLAESEATKLLQMVQALCAYHNLPQANDPELAELAKPTSPGKILDDLECDKEEKTA